MNDIYHDHEILISHYNNLGMCIKNSKNNITTIHVVREERITYQTCKLTIKFCRLAYITGKVT